MPRPTRGSNGTEPPPPINRFSGQLADGTEVTVVAAAIPDGAPAMVREGLVRRRLTLTAAGCPCGAVASLATDDEDRVNIAHADGCAAMHPDVLAAARAAFLRESAR